MLSFKEFITESKTTDHPFPDKFSTNLSPEEFKNARNRVAGIGMGVRSYNRYVNLKSELPADTHSDQGIKNVSKALDIAFDKNKNLSIDGDHTVYHATRHNVKFDKDGLTTIRALVSVGPSLQGVMTHVKKQYPGEDTSSVDAHHILQINYKDSGSVPMVYIGHHSARSSEKESILPPFTTFRHIETSQHGVHPETGKPIFVHTVEPTFTHPRYDRDFSSLSKDEKIKRFGHIKPMAQPEPKKKGKKK